MAIDNLKFAEEVNYNREVLINNLKNADVVLPRNTSLSQAVGMVGRIKDYYSDERGIEVVYYDIDGTVLKTEYVEYGGTPTPPSNPNYDSEYIKFIKWAGLPETITESINVIADYDTIEDNVSYLFIKCNEGTGSTLTFNFKFGTDYVVDWGDGIVDSTLTHTYSSYGDYIIKLTNVNSIGASKDNSSQTEIMEGRKMIVKAYWSPLVTNGYYGWEMEDCVNVEVLIAPRFTYKQQTVYGEKGGGFRNLKKLKVLVLKFDLTKLQSGAFQHCYNLKALVIETDTLTTISDSVCYLCYELTKMYIPDTVTSIGSNSFWMKPSNAGGNSYIGKLEYLHLPENLTSINTASFGYIAIKKIIIPKNVIGVGTSFRHMGNLKEVTFLGENTTLNQYTFENARLERIVFPSNLTTIPDCGIAGKYSLKKIILPQQLTEINSRIGYTGVEELLVPPHVTSINCTLIFLKNLIVPSENAINITTIKLGSSYLESIWVEDSILEDLKSATNWSAYGDYLKPISEMPENL